MKNSVSAFTLIELLVGQKPSVFILMAPAQNNNAKVQFAGNAGSASGVTVLRDSSNPGLAPQGGAHQKRARINALFGDLHSESLTWTTFTAPASGSPDDPSSFRWDVAP